MAKVLVGLSGGVDSAVCVKKLLLDGFEVFGVYLDMKSFDSDFPIEVNDSFGETEDIASAKQCADKYGIPLYKFGCASTFDRIVKEDFAREYSRGRTPNPCIICNRLVKFEYLCRCADMLGCEKIATGHYAKILELDGRYCAAMGTDSFKDQSYMLWNLTQEQLSRVLFPLGDTVKSDNFEIAKNDSLAAAERGESLDICFIGKNESYADFIEERLGKFPEGDFISPDGKVCGKHKGIIRYTVGQRKGLGIALGQPAFVKKIDGESNNIYLAFSGDEYTDTLKLRKLNFQGMTECDCFEAELAVKIRYAAKPVPAHLSVKDGIGTVTFNEPVRAATPGQSAVFYEGDKIMLGGFID